MHRPLVEMLQPWYRSSMLTLLLSAALHAHATEPAELPPALRGDVSLAYEARPGWIGLTETSVEGTTPVGRRTDLEHHLGLRATFAPVEGFAITAGFDHLPHRSIRFTDGRQMRRDPATGKPTADGPVLQEPPEYRGGGLLGFWAGVAFAPFAERYDRQDPINWRLDFGVRSGPPRTFWETNEADRRGSGDGGPTFRASTAFSKSYRVTAPYLVASWELTAPRMVTSTDGFGDPLDLEVDPGQQVDVIGGVFIDLTQSELSTTQVRLDLSTGLGYRSAARVPSGVLLPDVLGASRMAAANRAAHVGWHGGLAFDIEIAEPARLRLWSRAFWALPYRIEHPYPIRTSADSVIASFGAEITARYR